MRKEKLEELHNYINELKIIKRELLESYNNSYIKVAHYNCLLNNGITIVRDKIVKGKSRGNEFVTIHIT